MNLSEHFTLEEMTYTDHREFDNTPNEAETENLKRAAALMEQVRAALGAKPIHINSAFRSKQVRSEEHTSELQSH